MNCFHSWLERLVKQVQSRWDRVWISYFVAAAAVLKCVGQKQFKDARTTVPRS